MILLCEDILLTEGARDRALEMFIPYFQKRGINISISQLKQALLAKFVNEAGMHSLSLDSNFYLSGVARYYFNGDLTTNKQLNLLYPRVRDKFNPQVCQRLDALVEILRNSYVDSVGTKWEQPEDFGTLSIQQLFKKYNSKINKALGINTKETLPAQAEPQVNDDYTAGKNYTYEILYSYEDAKKYNSATEPGAWCITYGKQHYDAYIKRLKIHYVVFKQNGYENIPRQVGRGFTKKKPHDAYGNSLICVLQSNTSAKPIYITSRWNHGSYTDGTSGTEADHAYTTEEFLQVVGCDMSVLERAFEQWKANMDSDENKGRDRVAMRADRLNAMRQLKYAQMLINGGANPFQIQYLEITPIFSDEKNYLPGATDDYHPYNPKGLFWVKVRVNEEEAFVTFMDRKQIMFDKYLVSTTSMGYGNVRSFLNNYSDKYISFAKAGGVFMVYDRIRRQFLNLDGVISFPHGTSQFTAGYRSEGYKYGIIAMSGNQLALVNLETMKPVRSRGGSPWFESIVARFTHQRTNSDYRGRIDLPNLSIDGNQLKMVYDSASGEEYWFNTKTDSFIDTKTGVPEGFTLYDTRISADLPSSNYMMYVQEDLRDKLSQWGNPVVPFMFKDIDTNKIFSVMGKTTFLDFRREDNVISFRPTDSEEAYYADLGANKLITLNGQPVTTKYRCALSHESSSGYYCISQSRWYKSTDEEFPGRVVYGNFWSEVMMYNPYTKEFYHDEKNSVGGSGYLFHWYGDGYHPMVTPPGAQDWGGLDGKQKAIENGWLVSLPNAKEAAFVTTEDFTRLNMIIQEEINKIIGK